MNKQELQQEVENIEKGGELNVVSNVFKSKCCDATLLSCFSMFCPMCNKGLKPKDVKFFKGDQPVDKKTQEFLENY